MLISAKDLAASLEALVLLDVRYYLTDPERGRAEYLAGHIPGAHFVDLNTQLAGEPGPGGRGGRHPLPTLAAFQDSVRSWGINDDSKVVVYDQGPSLSAARAWWMLADSGIDVAVLDGGFAAWQGEGLPVSTEAPRQQNGSATLRPGRMGVADAADVDNRGGARLIDVRAANRYRGENETIDPVAGHIAGAENLPSTQLQEEDGRFASPEAIRSQFGQLSSQDILSCGSGITATQAALAAAHAGLEVPRVYIGSFSDWISDPTRLVERG